MIRGDVALLEQAVEKLKSGYEGKIKGTPIMIKSSMRIAYEQGIKDTVNIIAREGFDIVRKPDSLTAPAAQEQTP